MNMQQEGITLRREGRKWWAWGLGLMVVTTVVFALLNYVGLIGSTVVEREVFEHSFQYSEARQSEVSTYEAQLAEIRAQLADPGLDDATRNSLKAQRAAINVRLRAAKSK